MEISPKWSRWTGGSNLVAPEDMIEVVSIELRLIISAPLYGMTLRKSAEDEGFLDSLGHLFRVRSLTSHGTSLKSAHNLS